MSDESHTDGIPHLRAAIAMNEEKGKLDFLIPSDSDEFVKLRQKASVIETNLDVFEQDWNSGVDKTINEQKDYQLYIEIYNQHYGSRPSILESIFEKDDREESPYWPAEDAKKSPFIPQSCELFATLQTNGWLIKNIIPKAQLVVVYGAPGCGKSFAVLDMAMSVARDLGQWGDYRVKPGKVVYICAEAPNGFKNRIIAYSERHQVTLKDLENFTIIPNAPNLLTSNDVTAIYMHIGKADMIVVDTLARVMIGGDENAGKDVSLLIANCQRLHIETGATVVLIHHTGKDADKGSRGWSGLLGAVDTEIRVEAIGNNHKITVTKQKEGESGQQIGFNLIPITLGIDEDGDDITSCTFDHSLIVFDKNEKKEKLGSIEILIIECFDEYHLYEVDLDELRKKVILRLDRGNSNRDLRPQRFKNSIERLQEKNVFHINNQKIYRK